MASKSNGIGINGVIKGGSKANNRRQRYSQSGRENNHHDIIEERSEEERDEEREVEKLRQQKLSEELADPTSSSEMIEAESSGQNVWCGLLSWIPTKWSHHVLALRPWSFSISITPVLIGTALAYKTYDHFNPYVLLATLITVCSVHAAGNLVNTYIDFAKGVDSKRRSDDRTLVDHLLTPDQVVNLGAFFYILGCVGFILLCYLSPAKMPHLALVYFGGLSSSFLYTGGIGLKYIALGDVLIMLTFGPLSVLFSFLTQTGSIDLITLTYAIPIALNTEAIFLTKNTRDIDGDRRAGAVTLAILIGPSASHVLFALLLFIPYILFTVISFHYTYWFLLPLITLPTAFELERQFRTGFLIDLHKKITRLNLYAGLFFLCAIFASPPRYLPALSRQFNGNQ